MGISWRGYLGGVKEPGSNELSFGLLFRVAEVVMTIPHSNASEERIFSKNKTPIRSSVQLEGTLTSLKHISSEGATRAYNEQHK